MWCCNFQDLMTSTLFDLAIQNRRIIWSVFLKLGEAKVGGSISYSYQYHNGYMLQLVTPNNWSNFFSILVGKFVISISEENVLPTWSYFWQYYTEFLSICCIPHLPKTLRVIQFCYHVILKDYSLTFIWIERKISVGWGHIVATYLYYPYIGGNASWLITHLCWLHVCSVGLEDYRLSVAFLHFAFSGTFWKWRLKVCGTNFTKRSSMVLTELVPTSFPGSLIFLKRDPGLGWSRVYVYKWNPHRGWIFDLILSTLSMEVKVALLLYLESQASCFRDPAWPVFQSSLSKLLWVWVKIYKEMYGVPDRF